MDLTINRPLLKRFVSPFRALAAARKALANNVADIECLRQRIEAQRQRIEEERRRRRRLERRLERGKQAPPPQPLTPHRQVFQSLNRHGYRFANVVSYPKSGRTWFSTLYFHYARHLLGATELAQESLHMPDRNVAFQRLLAERARGGDFPVCTFTHLGFSALRRFESEPRPWPDKVTPALARPTVLIVRDPRDVVVSHYHHLQAAGTSLDPGLPLSEFIRSDWGIVRIVRFMNLWADAVRARHENLTICTFESMKRDTAGTFAAAMAFLGARIDRAAVNQAVRESSFDALKAREKSNRAYQGASLDPDAFRFRRGAVGGHTRELQADDVDYLNRVVAERLDKVFDAYHTSIALSA
jgi:alcohol sulfotransferase